QSSLRSGETVTPNGLLGIKLPSYSKTSGQFPNRFSINLKQSEEQDDCYARWMVYPSTSQSLLNAIEAAFQRRSTHRKWIDNPRESMKYNRAC
ncbi:MAG: hypothetical protein LBH31_05715, partial [Burkholderiaceae bacterium]|nr:hypothetical protein [Burkholderiaceae bacterium]